MNKMIVVLCMVGFMVGCRPEPVLTPAQYQAQYEARQFAERQIQQRAVDQSFNEAIIPPLLGYREIQLMEICLKGARYYYYISGTAVWLTPAIDSISGLGKRCER